MRFPKIDVNLVPQIGQEAMGKKRTLTFEGVLGQSVVSSRSAPLYEMMSGKKL